MNFRKFLVFCVLILAAPAFSKELADPYESALKHVKEVIKDAKSKGLVFVHQSLNPIQSEQKRKELRGVHISFDSKSTLDIEKSRKLLVELTEDLLTRINTDKELQEQSNPSPLTYKEINMDIAKMDDKGNFISDGTIADAFLLKGDIVYCKFNPKSHQLEKVLEEPYLKAKENL